MIGPLSISNLPAIKFENIWRVLGCLPETEESKSQFPKFGDSVRANNPLDPSQWQEIDLSWRDLPILDQGMLSACVGFGSCSGMEMCWMQSGRPLCEFSPYFIYALINNGRDQGAMISDALTALKQYGVCLKNDVPTSLLFRNQLPQSAFDSAKEFKLVQAYRCATFEEICSAISLGFVCPLGIYVGSNFPQVDTEGIAPLPAGGGGGHCILGLGLKKSSRYGWLIKIQNSWGSRFAMKGYCYIHKGHFSKMSPDAFAIQTILTDDDSIPVVI